MFEPTLHIIHLPEREDRHELLAKELHEQNITKYRIWHGFKDENNPPAGIIKAHKQIVQWAKQHNYPEVTIAEDDIHFTAPGAWHYYLSNKPSHFDIYLASVYVMHDIKGNSIENFTGLTLYTIKAEFYDKFLSTPDVGNIDVNLYGLGWYALCYPFAAIQHETFSDNSRSVINYSQYIQGKALFGHEGPKCLPINLFVNFYRSEDPLRYLELIKCFKTNLHNTSINKLFVFCTNEDVQAVLGFQLNLEKITFIIMEDEDPRPTFSRIFDEIKQRTREHEINIIANSDIVFDSTLQMVHGITTDQCYALSRWEFGTPHQVQTRGDSQDVWIFRGWPIINGGNFTMGRLGCDNRLAYDIMSSGLIVTNPSMTIKTWHLHQTNVRTYKPTDTPVSQPYYKIQPSVL